MRTGVPPTVYHLLDLNDYFELCRYCVITLKHLQTMASKMKQYAYDDTKLDIDTYNTCHFRRNDSH